MLQKLNCVILLFITSLSFSQKADSTYQKKVNKLLNSAYSFYLDDKDSLRFYFNSAKTLAYNNNDLNTLFEILNVECWDATYYGDLQLVKNNITELDSLKAVYKTAFNALPNTIYKEQQTNYTKGQYFDEIFEYDKSKNYFKQIINAYKKLPDSLITENFLNIVTEANIYLGAINSDESKFDLAKNYYLQNLNIAKNYSNFDYLKFNTYLKLADLNTKEKKHKQANKQIHTCLKYYKNTSKKFTNRLISIHEKLVKNHLNQENTDSAKYYADIMKAKIPSNHNMFDRFLKTNALVNLKLKKYNEAINNLEQNIAFVTKKWNNKPHLKIADAYLQLADLHLKLNNKEEALNNYSLALNQLPENAKKSTINKTLEFKILKQKAEALRLLKDYSKALSTTNKATLVLNNLKPSFKNSTDKLFLIENAFPVFENALNACYNLYKNSNNINYIKDAFNYSEKSKSVLLLESILASKAYSFANIPAEIIEKETYLKSKITKIEKHLNKKASSKLSDELFNLNLEYRELIETIEKNYPNYFNLKYNNATVKLEKIKKNLKNNEAIVSYFFGVNHVYTIYISRQSIDFARIENSNELKNSILKFQELITNPNSDISNLKQEGNKLYNLVLNPVLKNTSTKHLKIVPDGLLNYIPFGSLVSNSNQYVIENTSVSYCNSLTLLEELQAKTSSTNKLLAFAPSFKNNSNKHLLPLPHNKKEVENISKYFNSDSYKNEDATLENFSKLDNKHNIIHFATHAIFNDVNPEFSYLAFTKKDENDNLLYVSDIYNSKLKTDLVTLSACETGIGTLKRGEGFISLARSFFYAGANSICSSLWKINDASSTKIMSDFYENLANNASKDDALQNAKITFLKNNSETKLAHPYYWSGFIISGNTSTLTATSYWLYILLGSIAAFAIILFLRRKKRL